MIQTMEPLVAGVNLLLVVLLSLKARRRATNCVLGSVDEVENVGHRRALSCDSCSVLRDASSDNFFMED